MQQEKSKLSEFTLNSAANVVQNFQNPKLSGEKIEKKYHESYLIEGAKGSRSMK
ncbi:MAG: hypothetical protein LBK18_08920 [Prevotellaceae bacterium]|jgi:hypothetical protein|nr:hypothetical protein [Prevotellaceae bacterium]